MSYSQLLDLRAEESHVVRHVKPPLYREASRRPWQLSRAQTQAIGALAQGSYPLATRAPIDAGDLEFSLRVIPCQVCKFFSKFTPHVMDFNETWHIGRYNWAKKKAKKIFIVSPILCGVIVVWKSTYYNVPHQWAPAYFQKIANFSSLERIRLLKVARHTFATPRSSKNATLRF